jgi:hypothetical protein
MLTSKGPADVTIPASPSSIILFTDEPAGQPRRLLSLRLIALLIVHHIADSVTDCVSEFDHDRSGSNCGACCND